MAVHIHHLNENYKIPFKNLLPEFLPQIIRKENSETGVINVIYTNNEEILELNKQYLNHNYFTDVISFPYDFNHGINGDVFISCDKVSKNAEDYKTSFLDELLRVTIHGILHLTGYKDSTPEEKQQMRKKEDYYLEYFKINFS